MMEKAIVVMKQSINEPRADKKASPLVGAVLVKPDGTMDTAFRGELRHGDHAEYTLLERKHREKRLDGSVLFATLEPCAPGARKHPKLACAERIVNARIAEVWVGIEDPDPTVDRQGIRYLEQNGVKVHLFDLDLQEQIREVNKEFIAQALKRAAEAKDGNAGKPAPLSQWDEALAGVSVAALASGALTRYRARTKIPDKAGSAGFLQRLERQGLLGRRRSKLVEGRGFGMRTFGEAAAKHGLPVPRYAFDGLYLNLTIYRDAKAALGSLGEAVLNKLSKSERAGWEWLATKGSAKSSEYAAGMKLPYRTAMNHLKKFHELGLLERTGSARTTEYKARKP